MRSSRRLGRRNQNRRRRRGSKGAPSPSEEEEAAVATPQGHARGGVTGYLVKKKRGSDLRSFLADVVPLDRLLLEADCPYIMGLGVDDSRCASSTWPTELGQASVGSNSDLEEQDRVRHGQRLQQIRTRSREVFCGTCVPRCAIRASYRTLRGAVFCSFLLPPQQFHA